MGLCASLDARPSVSPVVDDARRSGGHAAGASKAPALRLPPPGRHENSGAASQSSGAVSSRSGTTTERTPRTVTREELGNHANGDTVWIALHGRVYDITGFLYDHPGGAHILREYAGTDASRAFDGAHAGEASRLGRWRSLKLVGRLDATPRGA